jgi:hypothetical protein
MPSLQSVRAALSSDTLGWKAEE